MLSLLVALGGMSALVAASPVPEITPAPSKLPLAKRQDPTSYFGCSFTQSVYTNVNQWGAVTATSTTDICYCSNNEAPDYLTIQLRPSLARSALRLS